MKSRLPILIIIPHGGYSVPEELAGLTLAGKNELFFEADTCANEIFSFDDAVTASIDSYVSRLFVDLDRPSLLLPPASDDGVIKKETSSGKPLFPPDVFPDEISISNILKRYYFPFYRTIEKILSTGEIKLILECHTMMPVGPPGSPDPGKPRPIISACNVTDADGKNLKTCNEELLRGILEAMKKNFSGETSTVAPRFTGNIPLFRGNLLKTFGVGGIPMLRLSVSRSLFLNEAHFNFDYLRVDNLRISDIRDRLQSSIERFYARFF